MKRTCCMLLALLLLLLCGCAAAEETGSVTGVWYGYTVRGQALCFDFRDKGVCVRPLLNSNKEQKGKWTLEGNLVTAKVGSATYYFRVKDGALVLDCDDSMFTYDDAVFTREPYELYTPAKQDKSAAKEAYTGLWRIRYSISGSWYTDLERRQKAYGSVWSYYASRDTSIWYLRIDEEKRTVELLGKEKQNLGTHPIKWNKDYFKDSEWGDGLILLEDGVLKVSSSYGSGMYFFREDEPAGGVETGEEARQ